MIPIRPIALLAVTLVAGCAANDTMKDPGGDLTWSRKAYLAGRASAKRDVQHGVLIVEVLAVQADWSDEYERLLRQRYKIEERIVASGCIVNDTIVGHLVGYNEISKLEITRRFGSDVFDRTAKEAQARYKQKSPRTRP